MDSSFLLGEEMGVSWTALTIVNVFLALYCTILFLRLAAQFGLPNHPVRLTMYLVSFCATIFFVGKATVALGILAPWFWIQYRPLPMVAGSLALLLQVIMCVGNFSLIQQKVVSRLPLMAALLCLAFFPTKAEVFVGSTFIAGALFLIFSVGKARYQKRMFAKLCFFLLLYYGLRWVNVYWTLVLGEVFLFFALFYFFVFQQGLGVAALVDDHAREQEGLKV